MAGYDRGYRTDIPSYGGSRGLEIVTYAPGPRPWSPDRRPPPPRTQSVGSSGGWLFNDPEMNRRRRVASYKAYSVEGKVKASLRKGIRWIKAKCSELVHGW